MPASTATIPDAANAFTMKSYSNIVRMLRRGLVLVIVAVRMPMVVHRVMLVAVVAFFVRVIELLDFDIARHHENAAVHAHDVDRRAI